MMALASPVDERCDVTLVHPESVAAARAVAASPEEVGDLAALFKLLGDATRVRLLYALHAAGELCVCDLARSIDTAETTVSAALRLLRTAGAVAPRREGRMVFYRLADAHVALLLELSREHMRHGTAT